MHFEKSIFLIRIYTFLLVSFQEKVLAVIQSSNNTNFATFGKKEFYVEKLRPAKDYNAAIVKCSNYSGYLAVIQNKRTNNFLKRLIGRLEGKYWLLSLNR